MKGLQNKGILGPFSHRVAQMIVCLLNANNNFPAAPKRFLISSILTALSIFLTTLLIIYVTRKKINLRFNLKNEKIQFQNS